ncbi:hypothetical protein [Streptomyces sp. SPB4]|uniref:hypothetical protein n=1 Tax=Streptomyces sp. SPB4 TaxID=2940553 RepID=UPI00247DB7BE|nr:hypothetical protein [Streptomyces sp. SPB4]
MSVDCSPRPPLPLARWNSALDAWETPQISLLCGHSVLYSAPWPTSGSMHAGASYAPLTSERRTGASGSSSLPGRSPTTVLFKTPTSNLATNGGSQHPAKRKQGGHGPNLADEVEWLLPTPTRAETTKASSDLPCFKGSPRLLPSPPLLFILPGSTSSGGGPMPRPWPGGKP